MMLPVVLEFMREDLKSLEELIKQLEIYRDDKIYHFKML
jgi:hypothetical protein